jgi:hypothetical protein
LKKKQAVLHQICDSPEVNVFQVDIKTQTYGPSHLHLDMLMDFLVYQLKASILIIQQDEATWGYGTYS